MKAPESKKTSVKSPEPIKMLNNSQKFHKILNFVNNFSSSSNKKEQKNSLSLIGNQMNSNTTIIHSSSFIKGSSEVVIIIHMIWCNQRNLRSFKRAEKGCRNDLFWAEDKKVEKMSTESHDLLEVAKDCSVSSFNYGKNMK